MEFNAENFSWDEMSAKLWSSNLYRVLFVEVLLSCKVSCNWDLTIGRIWSDCHLEFVPDLRIRHKGAWCVVVVCKTEAAAAARARCEWVTTGKWAAMVLAARVHFARRAHLASNVAHKSEVTYPLPAPPRPRQPAPRHLATDKIPNCFLAPGGRRPRFALKRRFKLHLWIALFTVLEIGVANCFSTLLDPSFYRSRLCLTIVRKILTMFFFKRTIDANGQRRHVGIGKCEPIRRLSVDNYGVGSRSYINNYRASATNGELASCTCKRGVRPALSEQRKYFKAVDTANRNHRSDAVQLCILRTWVPIAPFLIPPSVEIKINKQNYLILNSIKDLFHTEEVLPRPLNLTMKM